MIGGIQAIRFIWTEPTESGSKVSGIDESGNIINSFETPIYRDANGNTRIGSDQ